MGCKGATPPPAGGLAVERCLKEHVSSADTVSYAPSPTRCDCKASGVVRRSPQHRYHKADVRCLQRFLMEEASGGKGVRPP